MSKSNDPLAGLVPNQRNSADKADFWAGVSLKLTLLLIFVDIAIFAGLCLEQTALFQHPLLHRVLQYWEYPAILTVLAVLFAFMLTVMKMSYEAARPR